MTKDSLLSKSTATHAKPGLEKAILCMGLNK